MTSIRALIRRHPLPFFFATTFAISWGGVLLVIGGPRNLLVTSEQAEKLLPLALPAMFLGPFVAGIVLTSMVYGREGLREVLCRLRKWRVGLGWYAVALLTSPLLVTATLFAFSRFSREFVPDIVDSDGKATLLLVGIMSGLAVGLFEEIGWTGFAIPRLRLRHSILVTGLIVGFLWGAWHFLVFFWGSGTSSGKVSLTLLLPGILTCVGLLPAYRVLMVWVYDRTGSLLVAILMHAANTAMPLIAQPSATGTPLVIYNLVLVAAMWVVVAAVVVANRHRVAPPRKPVLTPRETQHGHDRLPA